MVEAHHEISQDLEGAICVPFCLFFSLTKQLWPFRSPGAYGIKRRLKPKRALRAVVVVELLAALQPPGGGNDGGSPASPTPQLSLAFAPSV